MRKIFSLARGKSNSALVVLKFGTISRLIPMVTASLLVTAILIQTPTKTFAQTAKPTPDRRDIGIQTNQQSNSATDQTKSKESKPELVLQTGYNNFFGATRLAFSPDGRLLATATFHTNTIKLWEPATGRELRDLSTGGQNTISQPPARGRGRQQLSQSLGSDHGPRSPNIIRRAGFIHGGAGRQLCRLQCGRQEAGDHQRRHQSLGHQQLARSDDDANDEHEPGSRDDWRRRRGAEP